MLRCRLGRGILSPGGLRGVVSFSLVWSFVLVGLRVLEMEDCKRGGKVRLQGRSEVLLIYQLLGILLVVRDIVPPRKMGWRLSSAAEGL